MSETKTMKMEIQCLLLYRVNPVFSNIWNFYTFLC